MKMHYATAPLGWQTVAGTACGGDGWTERGAKVFPEYRKQNVTRYRKQVTCKRCKRTKLFRGN